MSRRIQSIVVFVGLVLAAPARAQECLTGDATLGDQRALESLRTAIDETCPCDEPGRRPWQRCARTVLNGAVSAATLRSECASTALATIKSAACGTKKVPCGEVRESGKTRVACQLTSPGQCRNRRRRTRTPCTAQTHCADVRDWTAGTCADPRAHGPYGVGVRVIPLTKKSVNDPDADRTLDTAIWYPAAATATEPLDSLYRGVVDAPLEPSGGPYPLLLFSHGSCGYSAQSTFLVTVLASYGFIVAAPPHPPNTLQDGLANCAAAIGTVFLERPADMLFVLDWMLTANGDAASPFFGAIDAERVGMSGHSYGGMDTYRVTAMDARIKVAMPMAPAYDGTFATPLQVPSLTLLGAIDSRVSNPTTRVGYANGVEPKFLVEIGHAGHYAFSDLCFPGPDCNPPTTLEQQESHTHVLRWALPFLKVHLAGDESFTPFLEMPPEPGVTLEHAP